jgi:hypothetical protein
LKHGSEGEDRQQFGRLALADASASVADRAPTMLSGTRLAARSGFNKFTLRENLGLQEP